MIMKFLNKCNFFQMIKNRKNEKRGIIYLYKLLCENYHEEIINLIFKLTEISINQPNSTFSEIFIENPDFYLFFIE